MSYTRAENMPIPKKPDPIDSRAAGYEAMTFPEFEVDYERLPSKGKFYPPGSKINYKSYSWGHAKKLQAQKFNSIADLVKFVLKGVNPTFDKNFILVNDFLYIALARRLSSNLGTKFQSRFRCVHCGEESNTHAFDITDIDTYNLPDAYPRKIETRFGKDLVFEPANLREYLSLETRDAEDETTAMLAVQAKNLSFEEAYSIIEATTEPIDHEILNEVERDLALGVRPMKAVCKSCKGENQLELERWDTLISPFRAEESGGSPKSSND